MKQTEMIQWLQTEFKPVTLATPQPTLAQLVRNTFRYWNSHAAYRYVTMIDFAASHGVMEVSKYYKTVVQLWPNTSTPTTWVSFPSWNLLGISVLDNVTSDMILMTEAFRNYRQYVSSTLQFHFEPGATPDDVGRLYIQNWPQGASRACVVGTRRFFQDDDITNEYVLEWMLDYAKALLKIQEGNTLRKAGIINVKNDGQELVDEGMKEKADLQQRLIEEGRWVIFGQRM